MSTFQIVISIIAIIIVVTLFLILLLYILINTLVEKAKKKKATILAEFSARSPRGKIVFLGDSLTDFYPIDEFFHGMDIYNRGIAGDTTTNVLDRLDTNVYPLQPERIFLQIGTNDIPERKSPDAIVTNIKSIITKLKENIPGVIISVISLYPVNPKATIASRLFVGIRKNKEIEEINALLNKYCEEEKLDFINVYPYLLDNNHFLKKEYTIEGLHLTYEGYTVISSILVPYLKK